jgi:GNAT superfamily N-acetyltransferase
MLKLIRYDCDPEIHQKIADLWNAAAGPALAIRPDFVAYNTQEMPGLVQEGRLALVDEAIAGVVLASAVSQGPFRGQAWVDLIAVAPQYQRRGVGSALLNWAEDWLALQGGVDVHIGGSLNPFAPGLPVELGTQEFFQVHGYTVDDQGSEWDVARSITEYHTLYPIPLPGADLRPLQPGEEGELLAFLQREFPDRWLYEVELFFRIGGRASDFMVLRTEIGLDGFCWMTFTDSVRPLDRFYMHGLPKPWGQFGPLGVGKACRGKGYGGAMIDAAICHLKARGVVGSVIDWTSLLGLYGRFGYQPYRQYLMLHKILKTIES